MREGLHNEQRNQMTEKGWPAKEKLHEAQCPIDSGSKRPDQKGFPDDEQHGVGMDMGKDAGSTNTLAQQGTRKQ